MKRNEIIPDLLLGAFVLAAFGWLTSRMAVREDTPVAAPEPPQAAAPLQVAEAAAGEVPEPKAAEAAQGIKRASFKMFENVLPDDNFHPIYPPAVKSLDKRTVTVQGFMTPYDSLEDMKTFMLFGSPTGCNFCSPPSVNQVVLARQAPGEKKYPYIDKPIEITGTMSLWHKDSEDPMHKEMFLFVMDDVKVVALEAVALKEKEHRKQGFRSRAGAKPTGP
jgi:hypothetical protein